MTAERDATSDAVENFPAVRADQTAIRADRGRGPPGDKRRRADEAPVPDCGDAAVLRPRARGLEGDPGAANASGHIVGHDRARRRRVAADHAAETAGHWGGVENLQ